MNIFIYTFLNDVQFLQKCIFTHFLQKLKSDSTKFVPYLQNQFLTNKTRVITVLIFELKFHNAQIVKIEALVTYKNFGDQKIIKIIKFYAISDLVINFQDDPK